MIDRDHFFETIHDKFGSLTQGQVDGFNNIMDEWERREFDDERWLAYMLATVWHETGSKMQPILEAGSKVYLRRKPYYPYIGAGLVQVTWERNYKKFGANESADLLKWPLALHALFDGMMAGEYTGKSLGDYFNHRADDPVRARRVINGLDKATTIASYHRSFLKALAP